MPEEKEEEKSGAEKEEFKVFVRWDNPEEDDEDEVPRVRAIAKAMGMAEAPEGFEWVPLSQAFADMTAGEVFQVFVPGAVEGKEEEVWVWQQTNGESGEGETFWDAVGPFTKKDVVRLSRLKSSDYIDIDDEALVHGLQVYFRELRKLRAAKKAVKGEVKE